MVSNRIKIEDTRLMFDRAKRAAEVIGLDTHGWYLIAGNPGNGRMWRLFTRPGGGQGIAGLGRGFIGSTVREAYETLRVLAVAWETVAEHDRHLSQATESD